MSAYRRKVAALAPVILAVPLLCMTAATDATASPGGGRPHGHQLGFDGGPARGGDDDSGAIADLAEQYASARSAPGTSVSAGALVAARAQAAAMSASAGKWTEQTRAAFDEEPAGFSAPFWSNAGAGFQIASGRVTALAQEGKQLYAATAGGGVWSTNNGGVKWTPLSDDQASLSTGALAVNPTDHSVWIGTGEANTNSDSYLGTGVYRQETDGHGGPHGAMALVGGTALQDHQIYRLLVVGSTVFAATNRGLYRTSADGAGSWTLVLQPTPGSTSPYDNHITDVAVRPGSNGQSLVAVNGWRGGSPANAIYASADGGATWGKVTPTGDVDPADIGRTTLAYASDGRLYALMESPAYLAAGRDPKGAATNLKGLFVSQSGSAAGPWTLLADSTKLQASGSAITTSTSPGYNVGVQSWYNQTIAVDPNDSNTVFIGLEEVFKSTDGGATFTTASPYWDYGLSCGTTCPKTTHPDQHALAIADGNVVEGNDGGVYSRPESVTGYGSWNSLNATLHTLQFYDASAGKSGNNKVTFWGGLQDNGQAVVPSNGISYNPASGDGFYVVVDPANAQRAAMEYTNGTTYLTTDGGHSFTSMSPTCVGQDTVYGKERPDCDPNARFATPFAGDPTNANHWVLGGRYVWDTTKGYATRCTTAACDWTQAYDLGAANATTAIGTVGSVTYAAWVAGGNPSASFNRGIATNYGGTWHQLDVSALPNRYIAGVTVDPANGAHAYAVMNGYSRRWIDGAGNGIVFETTDGGASWRDLSGNLPDAPGDALVVVGGRLILGTDVGVFAASLSAPTAWTRLGRGLPNAPVNNLTIAPTGEVVAATHGRGIWTFTP